MTITITAFANSPDQGRGLARDMPVRWALEEVGVSYAVRLLSFPALKERSHRERQPFGQIPTYEDGPTELFESGAIVLRIAEDRGGLLPLDPSARSRAIAWMFAAIATVEPPIVAWSMASLFERDRPWFADRAVHLADQVNIRLEDLSRHLHDTQWLDGEFSAGDLLMICVLRRLGSSGLLEAWPLVTDYVARGEARPAFQRAFAAQKAVFEAAQVGIPETSASST